MHRCLTIVEVQHAIFQQVHDDPQGMATLARLAYTCRTLSHVALDVLWEELASIMYLIRCLPHDLWKSGYPYGMVTFEFKRAMSRSDWEILFKYSSRIRSLKHDMDSLFLDSSVITALSHPPSYNSLVPNLRSLSWNESRKEYMPLLQSLLAHSLASLALPCAVLWSSEILMHLISSCPSLKRFFIQGYGIPDAEGQKTLSDTLFPRLRSLESLTCPALDEAAIINLSRLSSLVNLSGHLRDNMQLEHPRHYLTPPTFGSLKYLTLDLCDNELSTFTSLLEFVRFKPQSVCFTTERSPTPDMFRSFFTALANACDSECLSDISFSVDLDRWLHSTDRHQISLSTFERLLALPNVESFSLDAMCNISLDDNAIDALTKQWPKITYLSFNPSFGWGIKSEVTHLGLIVLLSRCTSLAELTLAVDFGEVDKPPSLIPPSRLGKKLTTYCHYINFVSSKITFPVTIAAFLSDICPELDEVTSSWNENCVAEFRTYPKRWGKVNQWLPVFLAVRRQHIDESSGESEEE